MIVEVEEGDRLLRTSVKLKHACRLSRTKLALNYVGFHRKQHWPWPLILTWTSWKITTTQWTLCNVMTSLMRHRSLTSTSRFSHAHLPRLLGLVVAHLCLCLMFHRDSTICGYSELFGLMTCNETEGLTSDRWHRMTHMREQFMARGLRWAEVSWDHILVFWQKSELN